jgi:protein-L-isoaspartate(D-aspartate) O-methyltransferase
MDRKQLVEAFKALDRRQFLDRACRDLAGLDEPLPIGHGQTISQPTLVLEMTALLDPDTGSKVLELARLATNRFAAPFCKNVCTTNVFRELAQPVRRAPVAWAITNIRLRLGAGGREAGGRLLTDYRDRRGGHRGSRWLRSWLRQAGGLPVGAALAGRICS